ncbi:MAG: 3'-5' exonuclease [Rickettsiales bacterium]
MGDISLCMSDDPHYAILNAVFYPQEFFAAMTHDTLFVFDIETVPDVEAVFPLTGDPEAEGADVDFLRERLERYHLDVTQGKNPFPRQPFHKVVAISFLEAGLSVHNDVERLELTHIRSGGKEDSGERELIEGFFSYVGKSRARLVSFNGKGFDLPVLKYRAMKYGVSAPWLYRRGDKWNNYRQRYSADWHCDLLDELSDYGASARIKLNEVASIIGAPGKVGVDGSHVSAMYDAGEIGAIRRYCETDVANTYLIYLRHRLMTGFMDKQAYNDAASDLLAFVEGADGEHWAEFLCAWRDASEGKFGLLP